MSFAALRDNLLTRPFFYLLISLAVLFVFYGWAAHDYPTGTAPLLTRLVAEILVVCVLVSGVFALLKQRVLPASVVIGIAAVSLLSHVLRFVFPAEHDARLWLPGMLFDVLYYLVLIGAILASLMRARRVTADMILGAIATYFLLAIAWGYLYAALEIATGYANLRVNVTPDGGLEQFNRSHIFDCVYFSFTTITTLGYGDISPKLGLGRALAVIEAVLGQVYLAVLVARLVGIQLAQSMAVVSDDE